MCETKNANPQSELAFVSPEGQALEHFGSGGLPRTTALRKSPVGYFFDRLVLLSSQVDRGGLAPGPIDFNFVADLVAFVQTVQA